MKKLAILALILSIAALGLGVYNTVTAPKPAVPVETAAPAQAAQTDTQYVLYLGTNDKDTNEPVCTPEEAKAKAIDILLRRVGGYTIQEARGGWIDGETVYTEYTLVIYLSDTDADTVHAVADELIAAFNQTSVLIQANQTSTEFYSGTN